MLSEVVYPLFNDKPYRDVRTQGKLQSRLLYQSNKKEQMNQHELSVYLLIRFGVVCPFRDFCWSRLFCVLLSDKEIYPSF